MVAIDVVIPSFRLNAVTLLPILNLQTPANAIVKFYLVADNPAVVPHQSIMQLVDNEKIFLTINKVNEGASVTRNIGIEAGQGDWILFLDDDIEVLPDLLFAYSDAALQNPNEIGFIGVVNLPDISTPFAHAVNANGSMSMFAIAKHKQSFAWGVTANFMVSRKAVGNVRFSDIYPKTGGGEDVEFFIRIRELHNFKNYKCINSADVTHPWWNNGQPDFKRFYRYGKGISHLPERNPRYSSYSFLNTVETLFVALLILGIAMVIDPQNRYLRLFPQFILLTIALEYLVSLRIAVKNKQGFIPLVALYVMALRLNSEAGVLFETLLRFRLAGLGERFHFDGRTKKSHFSLNTNKIIKLVFYLLAICYAIYQY
ncbi:glycosyltransferase involved in cell wall biosynthesis [Mucilaginibacter sp. UYP25]|uniref:glycosyltransferase family 2 protein n=1 Tax=unclassified Mucilaginibacter TaxID=2617802 RepID=UPI00339405F5